MLLQTKSNHLNAEIGKGYITLDDTDSLEYNFKVETGKITDSVLESSLFDPRRYTASPCYEY